MGCHTNGQFSHDDIYQKPNLLQPVSQDFLISDEMGAGVVVDVVEL